MGINLKDDVSRIAQDVRRNGNEGNGYILNNENLNMFNRILDIFDSISIECEILRKNNRQSINLIKIILESLAGNQKEQNNSNSIFHIDEKNLASTFEDIATTLVKQQNSFDNQIASLTEEHEKSYRELGMQYNQTQNQISEYKVKMKSIAEYIQFCISKAGNSEDLSRILEIMGMKAIFPEDMDEEKIAQYFSILKTTLLDNTSVSPCIMFGEEIFIHGKIVKYVEES